MVTERPQWPHTVSDITKALDGVWGVVGAQCLSGNLARLERSLSTPVTYTLVEFKGMDENSELRRVTYSETDRQTALREFATLLGFTEV